MYNSQKPKVNLISFQRIKVFIVTFLLSSVSADTRINCYKSNCIFFILDVLDKIKAGLQYASNYLETAKDIADLVSKSLDHKQKQKRGEDENDEKQPFGPSNFVSAFFRLVGFDSQKVAAIAVNSVVFLAQMVNI